MQMDSLELGGVCDSLLGDTRGIELERLTLARCHTRYQGTIVS